MAFDKAKYDIEYMKENRSQFKVDLKKDEKEELDALLQKKGLKKVEVVRWAMKKLKDETPEK